MRLSVRDVVAALLVAAILTPYAGLLVRGRMPYVENVRGMAVVAFVLGLAAFLIADGVRLRTFMGCLELGLAAGTLGLGAITAVAADGSGSQNLLGAFITGIVLTWGAQLLDHAGVFDGSRP
jgi:hypothetical protein